jgi:Cytochrome B6-F complex subunit VI (PetL)
MTMTCIVVSWMWGTFKKHIEFSLYMLIITSYLSFLLAALIITFVLFIGLRKIQLIEMNFLTSFFLPQYWLYLLSMIFSGSQKKSMIVFFTQA